MRQEEFTLEEGSKQRPEKAYEIKNMLPKTELNKSAGMEKKTESEFWTIKLRKYLRIQIKMSKQCFKGGEIKEMETRFQKTNPQLIESSERES